MIVIKQVLQGVFRSGGKILNGVANGLNQGVDELAAIPDRIHYKKRENLSGRYTVEISEGKNVTISFYGGAFYWDIEEYCGKELTDEAWDSLSEYARAKVNSRINSWAHELLKRNGTRP